MHLVHFLSQINDNHFCVSGRGNMVVETFHLHEEYGYGGLNRDFACQAHTIPTELPCLVAYNVNELTLLFT